MEDSPAVGHLYARARPEVSGAPDIFRSCASLAEFDLVCFYCDEALLHNTPIEAVNFGFPELTAKVKQSLGTVPGVFDRIFLFHPYEAIPTVQVYGN